MVFAFSEQLHPFHASVVPPSPETHTTLVSLDHQSPLHTGMGFAMTIQFPQLINGESHCPGFVPKVFAGAQKHIAVHIPRVNVGVT